jgi:hypothetical protein
MPVPVWYGVQAIDALVRDGLDLTVLNQDELLDRVQPLMPERSPGKRLSIRKRYLQDALAYRRRRDAKPLT